MNDSTIIIGGDLCPTSTNQYALSNNPTEIFGSISDLFKKSKCVVVNLECPLTTSEAKSIKSGPNLKSDPSVIMGIRESGINILSLANNHIMDYGHQGLRDTFEAIQLAGLQCVGAGNNIFEARKILYTDIEENKIAIISVAEHEFSPASETEPGFNPANPYNISQDIITAKETANIIIVLYHGGAEEYRFPTPNLQQNCRALADLGANVIVCQHSHCIGAYEKYNGADIVYGQGNILFDYKDIEMWKTGLLLKISLLPTGYTLDFIPIIKKGNAVELANASESKIILDAFTERNKMISSPCFINEEWTNFCMRNSGHYLRLLCSSGILFKALDKVLKGRLSTILYKKNAVRIWNILRCETHNEVLQTILQKL